MQLLTSMPLFLDARVPDSRFEQIADLTERSKKYLVVLSCMLDKEILEWGEKGYKIHTLSVRIRFDISDWREGKGYIMEGVILLEKTEEPV